jgi:ATP-dependent Lhr-like helicase
MHRQHSKGFKIIEQYLAGMQQTAFPFQIAAWHAIQSGKSGLVKAPTGMGKTFAVFLSSIIQFIDEHPNTYTPQNNNGLQLLWITPLKALVKDLARAMVTTLKYLNIPWHVGIRTGDTTTQERQLQKKQLPEILLITPESLHLLFTHNNHAN